MERSKLSSPNLRLGEPKNVSRLAEPSKACLYQINYVDSNSNGVQHDFLSKKPTTLAT